MINKEGRRESRRELLSLRCPLKRLASRQGGLTPSRIKTLLLTEYILNLGLRTESTYLGLKHGPHLPIQTARVMLMARLLVTRAIG